MHNVQYVIDISRYSPQAQAKFIELNNRMAKEFEEEERLEETKNTALIEEKKKSIDSLPDVLTAQHIASHLGISRRRVYEFLQIPESQGGIKNWQIGKSRKINKTDLEIWLEKKHGSLN